MVRPVILSVGVVLTGIGGWLSETGWIGIRDYACCDRGPGPHCAIVCAPPWGWLLFGATLLGVGLVLTVLGIVLRTADQEAEAALAEQAAGSP